MNVIKKIVESRFTMLLMFSLSLTACYPDEGLNVPVKTVDNSTTTALDDYINENFVEEYGVAIRYRFVDNYVDPTTRVTPPRLSVVRPMLDFIEEYWVGPYFDVANGEEFFRDHVPGEVILLGGPIYTSDGNLTLGVADAGARITFTDVNSFDLTDEDWVLLQLRVVYHEFAHIVHQRHRLPTGFETISPQGYTSQGSWFVLNDEEALLRGFVSPYATSQVVDDYAETVSYFLFDKDFYDKFITIETGCTTAECEGRNEGRKKIQEKLSSISEHYEKVTGVKLESVRAAVQSRLN